MLIFPSCPMFVNCSSFACVSNDVFTFGIGLQEHLKIITALAGVAQWIESQPEKQRVAGWMPSQGTCLGFRPGPL